MTAISISIADPALASAVTASISAAIAASTASLSAAALPTAPIVRVRARRSVARSPSRFSSSIAIIPITARNARHLIALIDALRAAGALGIQLHWDGSSPPRATVEHHVFAALEHARATPALAPIVLAATPTPVSALHTLIAARRA